MISMQARARFEEILKNRKRIVGLGGVLDGSKGYFKYKGQDIFKTIFPDF